MAVLWEFTKKLFSRQLVIAFLVVDAVSFALVGGRIPSFVFPLALVIGLAIGSFQIYAEMRSENQRLRSQLADAKSTEPKLQFGFLIDGQLSAATLIRLHPLVPQPDFDALVHTKESELLSRATPPEATIATRDPRGLQSLLEPRPEAYTTAVASYLRVYRSYLEETYTYHLNQDRLRSFFVMLMNKGGSPAEKVTIEIAAPDASLLPTQNDIIWYRVDREDEPPSPPAEPRVGISYIESAISGLSALAYLSPRQDQDKPRGVAPNTEGPRYPEEGAVIRYLAREVVHNLPERDFEPFLLYLGDIQSDTTITLPVRIIAGNIPEPVSQALTVQILIDVRATEPAA